jgi:hypothetical protein
MALRGLPWSVMQGRLEGPFARRTLAPVVLT